MSKAGLRTEVSTDILLVENKEVEASGILFVEDIQKFCEEQQINIPTLYTICKVLQERYAPYSTSASTTISILLTNISQLKEEVNALELLIKKKEEEEEVKHMFSLAPLLYTEATIAPQEKCYVKLSDTVMVEMTLEEALEFTKDRLDQLIKSEEKARKLFNFYRDQNTILTLNINRCYAMIQSDISKEKEAKK